MTNKTIIKVWQDGTQLVLRFCIESLPALEYINTQLRERLQNEYDNDLIHMIQASHCTGTVDVSFCPSDTGSVNIAMWDVFCNILEEYSYTLKDARTIIQWMDECIVMENVEHVYVQILEGAQE